MPNLLKLLFHRVGSPVEPTNEEMAADVARYDALMDLGYYDDENEMTTEDREALSNALDEEFEHLRDMPEHAGLSAERLYVAAAAELRMKEIAAEWGSDAAAVRNRLERSRPEATDSPFRLEGDRLWDRRERIVTDWANQIQHPSAAPKELALYFQGRADEYNAAVSDYAERFPGHSPSKIDFEQTRVAVERMKPPENLESSLAFVKSHARSR